MITYKRASNPVKFVLMVLQKRGSVFITTTAIALPCALCSMALKFLSDFGHLGEMDHPESILINNAVWSGFTFLVGFLIVFRTSQAYSRFWDGCTATQLMRAEWFDAASAIIAFGKFSKVSDEALGNFQACTVALFSLLHALAHAEFEDSNSDELDDIKAFTYELVHLERIDILSLQTIKRCDAKVELVYQWIQQLLVENIDNGVLNIPAPILSRVFQELANGMVHFQQAIKISTIPFPFPYAQTCDALLAMHWLVSPVVISQWVSRAEHAFLFTFIQVFIVWALRSIATEIENPFGMDQNDINARAMQQEMNRSLTLLLERTTLRTPPVATPPPESEKVTPPVVTPPTEPEEVRSASLAGAWAELENGEVVHIRRTKRRDRIKGEAHLRRMSKEGNDQLYNLPMMDHRLSMAKGSYCSSERSQDMASKHNGSKASNRTSEAAMTSTLSMQADAAVVPTLPEQEQESQGEWPAPWDVRPAGSCWKKTVREGVPLSPLRLETFEIRAEEEGFFRGEKPSPVKPYTAHRHEPSSVTTLDEPKAKPSMGTPSPRWSWCAEVTSAPRSSLRVQVPRSDR